MPIIDHTKQTFGKSEEGRSSRPLITKEHGAKSLTVRELMLESGSRIKLHTHPTDEAIMLMEGQVEFRVGNEKQIVEPGTTLLAPPATPHGIVNISAITARMLTIYPTDNPQITWLE